MTETLTKVVVNCETGEEEVLPLTEAEIAEVNALRAKYEEEKAAAEAEAEVKAQTKASAIAKLAALGLTEEEAAAIAGA